MASVFLTDVMRYRELANKTLTVAQEIRDGDLRWISFEGEPLVYFDFAAFKPC